MSEGITGDHKNDLLDDSIGLPILRRISSGYIATSTWTLATSSAFSESTAEALTRHQKTYLVPGSAEIARRCIITYIHLRRLRGRGGKLTGAYADFTRRGGVPSSLQLRACATRRSRGGWCADAHLSRSRTYILGCGTSVWLAGSSRKVLFRPPSQPRC